MALHPAGVPTGIVLAGPPMDQSKQTNPCGYPGDSSQTVTVKEYGMLDGYDMFQTNFGDSLAAHNTSVDELGGHMFRGREGNTVLCRWSIKQAKHYFAAVEPNDLDWHALDVVTRTSLSINFSAQSFVHRHYTRPIQLPPWTQIGPEIARW
jgi:hypothetical protein